MFHTFLIKYAEIGLKGKNRYVFEDALVSHIHHSLKRLDGKFTVTKEAGRIYATAAEEFDYDEVIDALKKVFGIAAICPMVQLEDNGYDDLKAKIVEYVDKAYPDKHFTFKVNTRRANKQYPHTSEEVNRDLGEVILDAFPETKVDVHNPDVLLNVELRAKRINVYSLVIPGPGGMPVGTNGRAMLLLSGGIDSPVAGYMIAKRVGFLYIRDGVKIRPILFGGGQQKGMRSGTENVPGCVGLGVAAREAYKDFDARIEKLYTLREHLIAGLKPLGGVTINGSEDRTNAPQIVSASFEGVRSEVLLHALEDKGVYVSSGSACSSNHPGISGTLKGIGVKKELLDSTIRFSLGDLNTEEEVDYAIGVLGGLLPVLRRYQMK